MPREAARRTQCQNHLKQLGLGGQNHHAAQGYFPSGGWGYRWVGDPDLGFGANQPGGWVYSLLPYIEEQAIHGLGAGGSASEKKLAAERLVQSPVAMMNCPSRRSPGLFPHKLETANSNRPYNPGFDGVRTDTLTDVARNDYAANSGSYRVTTTPGPTTLADADRFGWPRMELSNGIVHIRSEIGARQIVDGLSKTYLWGEKYVNANNYEVPDGIGEAQSMYIGFDPDTCRWGQPGQGQLPGQTPLRDTPGFSSDYHFGSAPPRRLLLFVLRRLGSIHPLRHRLDDPHGSRRPQRRCVTWSAATCCRFHTSRRCTQETELPVGAASTATYRKTDPPS